MFIINHAEDLILECSECGREFSVEGWSKYSHEILCPRCGRWIDNYEQVTQSAETVNGLLRKLVGRKCRFWSYVRFGELRIGELVREVEDGFLFASNNQQAHFQIDDVAAVIGDDVYFK